MPPKTCPTDPMPHQAELHRAAPAVRENDPGSTESADLPEVVAGEASEPAADSGALQKKIEELQDLYVRAVADLQNARRRADDEVAKARKFAVESFAESLLPVADSLEASLSAGEATREQLYEGSEATLRQLRSAFQQNKVVAIAPVCGDRFDPHVHQAITAIAAKQPPNTVVELLQKGYALNDRVLRPALVTVAASH